MLSLSPSRSPATLYHTIGQLRRPRRLRWRRPANLMASAGVVARARLAPPAKAPLLLLLVAVVRLLLCVARLLAAGRPPAVKLISAPRARCAPNWLVACRTCPAVGAAKCLPLSVSAVAARLAHQFYSNWPAALRWVRVAQFAAAQVERNGAGRCARTGAADGKAPLGPSLSKFVTETLRASSAGRSAAQVKRLALVILSGCTH